MKLTAHQFRDTLSGHQREKASRHLTLTVVRLTSNNEVDCLMAPEDMPLKECPLKCLIVVLRWATLNLYVGGMS